MGRYIKVTFKNIEPLQIADDSRSQSEQTNALTYIPGSAIRGAVIGELIRQETFEGNEKGILEHVFFLNGYPLIGEKELIPSPKGLYEDKTDEGSDGKNIENMLITGDITPGNKRASVGKYSYFDREKLYYMNVRCNTDMKIAKGKGEEKKVFRREYIMPGYTFCSYIKADDDLLHEKIFEAVQTLQKQNNFILGGARSYGFGKCHIECVEKVQDLPYGSYAVSEDVSNTVYMYLLSHSTMLDDLGENVGINGEELGILLGLDGSLEIERCSTSVTEIRGYNRKFQTFLPSVKMYEAGSVFKLTFKGKSISADRLRLIMESGIGVRKNEGFGRVLFLKDFDKIKIKKKLNVSSNTKKSDGLLRPEDAETLRIIARGYYQSIIEKAIDFYVQRHDFRKYHIKKSQMGMVESILFEHMYEPEVAKQKLSGFIENNKKKYNKKNVQSESVTESNINAFHELTVFLDKKIEDIFVENDFPMEVMGCKFTEVFKDDEIMEIKFRIIVRQIRLANRDNVQERGV